MGEISLVQRIGKPITYQLIVGSLVLVTALSLLGGCKKDKGNESKSSSTEKKQDISQHTKADSELSQAFHRASVLESLVITYNAAKQEISQDSNSHLFLNSIEHTMKGLEKWRDALVDGYGLAIPPETYADSGVQRYGNIFSSNKYWDDLKEGMGGFGYRLSCKLDNTQIDFLAKEFYKDSFPDNVVLISDGQHKGFFVGKEGDLIVPGVSFYINVAEGNLNIASFKTTDFYWQSKYMQANKDLQQGNFIAGKEALDDILEQDLVAAYRIPEIYYNRAVANEKLGENESALQDYSKAIELNINKSGAYFNRGMILMRDKKMYAEAIKDFTKAPELSDDPSLKIKADSMIGVCNKMLEFQKKMDNITADK